MTKRSPIILIAVLLVAAIWRAPLTPVVRFNFELAFIWGTLIVLSYWIAVNINLWAGLFLALASMSAYYPIDTVVSMKAHSMVLYGVVWYCLSVHFLNTPEKREWMLSAICVVALANVAFLISQGVFDYDPIHSPVKPLYRSVTMDLAPNVGLMSCVNGASGLLAMCFFAFNRKHRIEFNFYLPSLRWPSHWHYYPVAFTINWRWFGPLVLVGLVLAHTFGGPLAVVAGLYIYAILSAEKIHLYQDCGKTFFVCFLILLSASILYLFYRFVDVPDVSWRLMTWKKALFDLYPQRPWIGGGIGHWKIVFSKGSIARNTLNQVMGQAHNEFVQGLFEMGRGFALIIGGYYLSILFKLRKVKLSREVMNAFGGLICITVVSSVFFPFHIGLSAMIALTLLANLQGALADAEVA